MAVAGIPLAPAVTVGLAALSGRWTGQVARLAGGRTWRAGLLFGVGLSVITTLAALPLSSGRFAWGRRYGLVTQSTTGWLLDVGKGVAIGAVLSAAVASVVAVLIARLPRTWWLGVAGGGAALVFAGSLLAPVLIEPLFQKTRPLDDPVLAREVLDVASREGVTADRVLVNDASARTSAANAYVSGFGGSRRIVLYDTLLRDFPRDQVLTVVAHEVAHVKHRHVLKGSIWAALLIIPGALVCFAAVGGRTGWAPATGPSLVLRRLVIVAATASVVGAVSAPVGTWISRDFERQADWTALETTQDPGAMVRLFQGFINTNLGVPDTPSPLQFWFGTHPTAIERIGMANRAAQ